MENLSYTQLKILKLLYLDYKSKVNTTYYNFANIHKLNLYETQENLKLLNKNKFISFVGKSMILKPSILVINYFNKSKFQYIKEWLIDNLLALIAIIISIIALFT